MNVDFFKTQENNAYAVVDINNGIVSKVCPLPKKDWSFSGVDASDRDGGKSNLHSLICNRFSSLTV